MSIWLGGLATLAFIMLRSRPRRRPRSARRFSPVALTSVRRDRATGLFASWRKVGFSRDAFLDTTFGRLLARQSRRCSSRWRAGGLEPPDRARPRPGDAGAMAVTDETDEAAPGAHRADRPSVRGLRWSVGGELIFGIAVIDDQPPCSLNAQPARSALARRVQQRFAHRR